MTLNQTLKSIHEDLCIKMQKYTPYYFTITLERGQNIIYDSRQHTDELIADKYTFSVDALSNALLLLNTCPDKLSLDKHYFFLDRVCVRVFRDGLKRAYKKRYVGYSRFANKFIYY